MNDRGTVLISGAGIAGAALAFWLRRYGFDVTVVERSARLRSSGYPIDVRGTAVDVVRRMGLLPRLREAHIETRLITFRDADGSRTAAVHPQRIVGGVEGEDIELRRGDLVRALCDAVPEDVEFWFGDSVESLDEHAGGVHVSFRSGTRRDFDLVVGADGLHSRTRELVLGPEQPFHRYLRYCFAGFTMPNTFGLSHEGVIWNAPGKAAALYGVQDSDELHAFLNLARPQPPAEVLRDTQAQRDLMADAFAGEGWEIPAMVTAMREADDLFFDTVSQIHLPSWSSGRVALVGDAAYAPSFLTGQGSSLALVGAYVLAGALATRADHRSAFAAYERNTREFVELNQSLVGEGDAALFPTTAEALQQRNEHLRNLTTSPPDAGREAHSALTLPDFEEVPATS